MKNEMLKNMVRGRWRYILLQFAPVLVDALDAAERRRNAHVPCPMPHHSGDGTKKNFRMFADFEQTGGAVCTCGTYSDGFSVLQAYFGWTFKQTCEEVEKLLNGHVSSNARPLPPAKPSATPEEVSAQQKKEDERRVNRIKDAWSEAVPLSDERAEPVWRYLLIRGLSPRAAAEHKALRCHPSLAYFDENGVYQGSFPALLAAITSPAGKVVTLHRTYLDPAGCKLPVEDNKKPFLLPSAWTMRGGAIRLGIPGRVLGVAEGFETAQAVTLATRQVVWPCVSANGIESFEPPAGVEEVWIWADHDRSKRGIEAAKVLKMRLWERKMTARIMLPAMPIPEGKKGVDWNDVLKEQGSYGFPAAMRMVPLRHKPVPTPKLAAGGEE